MIRTFSTKAALAVSRGCVPTAIFLVICCTGCEQQPAGSEVNPETPLVLDEGAEPTHGPTDASRYEVITAWVSVPELPVELAIFQDVFWEPDDTTSLRKLIAETDLVHDRTVLEIGTGSGLISLCSLQAGASRAICTDINPAAAANARFNAKRLRLDDQLDVRLVPRRDPSAWSTIRDDERFDLIISNPPWENQTPTSVADFALYDPDFALLESIVGGLHARLNPDGKALLAYGCVTAIRRMEELAKKHHCSFRILDDRKLDELPEVFLPGMLVELTPIREADQASLQDQRR